jgi:hypothetical protein
MLPAISMHDLSQIVQVRSTKMNRLGLNELGVLTESRCEPGDGFRKSNSYISPEPILRLDSWKYAIFYHLGNQGLQPHSLRIARN